MSQRAFATYLSQTKDGQFDTIQRQFKKVNNKQHLDTGTVQ